jgi:CheY-like chemotaxis protein
LDPDEPPLEGVGGIEEVGPKRLRILVAEDEFLVAVMLERDLRAIGCSVVGPFTSLARAMEAAHREEFELAVLDVNMNGEMVYPLADELLKRGLPFVFLTGYAATSLPERFRTLPRIAKPYELAALAREIGRIVPKAF